MSWNHKSNTIKQVGYISWIVIHYFHCWLRAAQTHCSLQGAFCWLLDFMWGWTPSWFPPCWCGWLRKTILPVNHFRKGHFHNQLTHLTDTAVSLKGRPPSGPLYKFSFLYHICGHFCVVFWAAWAHHLLRAFFHGWVLWIAHRSPQCLRAGSGSTHRVSKITPKAFLLARDRIHTPMFQRQGLTI